MTNTDPGQHSAHLHHVTTDTDARVEAAAYVRSRLTGDALADVLTALGLEDA